MRVFACGAPGLNLLPCDDDAAARAGRADMGACLKSRALEERAAAGASAMAAAFAIGVSRFNAGLGPQEVAIRFGKSMDYQMSQGERARAGVGACACACARVRAPVRACVYWRRAWHCACVCVRARALNPK
jgi:hypothetical protein